MKHAYICKLCKARFFPEEGHETIRGDVLRGHLWDDHLNDLFEHKMVEGGNIT